MPFCAAACHVTAALLGEAHAAHFKDFDTYCYFHAELSAHDAGMRATPCYALVVIYSETIGIRRRYHARPLLAGARFGTKPRFVLPL